MDIFKIFEQLYNFLRQFCSRYFAKVEKIKLYYLFEPNF